MTFSSYYSIFRFQVPGWHGLYWNHSTDMCSVLWCSSLLARSAAPLVYHFLLVVDVQGTTFQGFMGKIDLLPVLGDTLNTYFPMVVAFLCVFNLLNVCSGIRRVISALLSCGGLRLNPDLGGLTKVSAGKRLLTEERDRRRAEWALLAPPMLEQTQEEQQEEQLREEQPEKQDNSREDLEDCEIVD